jgi:hypothetical protein
MNTFKMLCVHKISISSFCRYDTRKKYFICTGQRRMTHVHETKEQQFSSATPPVSIIMMHLIPDDAAHEEIEC